MLNKNTIEMFSFTKISFFILDLLASFVRNVDPTRITWFLIPLGLLAGIFFFFNALPIALIMTVATGLVMGLDGFIARKNAKTTIYGCLLNSVFDDISEVLIFLGISFSFFVRTTLGLFTIIILLLDSLIENIEQNINTKISFRGILSRQNRVTLLIVFTMAQLLVGPQKILLGLNVLEIYMCIAIFLGLFTIIQAIFAARADIRALFKYKLFNPGPVNTSQRVKTAMMYADMSHRDQLFSDEYKKLLEKLKKIYKADENFAAVVISGSATATSEALISSCVPDGKKLLIISNGAFGERLRKIAHIYNIQSIDIIYKWGQAFDLAQIENSIENNQDNIFMVAMVHHETSTGMLNPLQEVGGVSKKYNKYLLADCVSSLGSEDIDIRRDKIDACFAGDNKCLHAFAGASNCCISKKLLEKIQEFPPRNFYMDLRMHFKYAATYQTPTTPAVNSFLALSEALSEIEEEGLENRWQKYKMFSGKLRDGMKHMGLRFFLPEELMSHSVTSVYLPEGFSFIQLFNAMKNNGFIIYGGKEELKNKIFQVANMGNLTNSDLDGFLSALESILRRKSKGLKLTE